MSFVARCSGPYRRPFNRRPTWFGGAPHRSSLTQPYVVFFPWTLGSLFEFFVLSSVVGAPVVRLEHQDERIHRILESVIVCSSLVSLVTWRNVWTDKLKNFESSTFDLVQRVLTPRPPCSSVFWMSFESFDQPRPVCPWPLSRFLSPGRDSFLIWTHFSSLITSPSQRHPPRCAGRFNEGHHLPESKTA